MNDERTCEGIFEYAKCETCGEPATTWISDTMNVDCSQEYIEYDMSNGGHLYCKACFNALSKPAPPLGDDSEFICGWQGE